MAVTYNCTVENLAGITHDPVSEFIQTITETSNRFQQPKISYNTGSDYFYLSIDGSEHKITSNNAIASYLNRNDIEFDSFGISLPQTCLLYTSPSPRDS